MKNISRIIIIGIILLIVIMGLTGCASISTNTQESIENKKIEECQHEWVVTSRYNFFLEKYQVFSKCTKCGKEM